MASNPVLAHTLGENVNTNTHVMLSVVCFVLATPYVNPVLVLCETCGIPTWIVSLTAVLFFVHTLLADLKNVAYYSVRVFFNSILSIFFRSIVVVGADNIPPRGPIIFTGNHNNQFVDGLNVLCHARHRISFLIAQASWDKPVIGHLAWLMGAVPVQRPQDAAKKGKGKVVFDGTSTVRALEGTTDFKAQLNSGDKLRIRGQPDQFKVATVHDDTIELVEAADLVFPNTEGEPVEYDCLGRVDQAAVFGQVFENLKQGSCLGIFPEGGSHDRTDLLPLKPGVAIIAMGALEKHGLSVPIVPVGLSYFNGHSFRGRCVIEFGPPIMITPELFKEYQADKRVGCNKLLEQVEEGLRGCLCCVATPEDLETVYMTRRLYCRDRRLTASQKQDLNRRFAYWYSNSFLAMREQGKVPAELDALNRNISSYRDALRLLGLKDYQVRHIQTSPTAKVLGTIAHMLLVMLASSVPNLLLNMPVGIYARLAADKHQIEALRKSNVKLKASDVRMSKMIVICVVGVPVLWLCYALLMLLTGFGLQLVLLFLIGCPLMSYLGVIAAESGMVDLKDLRPVLLRLFVNHDEMLKLIERRQRLQEDVRNMVRKYGPEIGDVYFKSKLSWSNLQLAPTDSPPADAAAAPPADAKAE